MYVLVWTPLTVSGVECYWADSARGSLLVFIWKQVLHLLALIWQFYQIFCFYIFSFFAGFYDITYCYVLIITLICVVKYSYVYCHTVVFVRLQISSVDLYSYDLAHAHTHILFTATFLGLPSWAGARRKLLLDFMVQGKITEADTPTIRLGATPSGLISAHLHHTIFLKAGCPSCCPNNSVKALKATSAFGLGRRR